MAKKFQITATCDPYNALFHYKDQRVLAFDGAAPIKWLSDDNYGDGFDHEEALSKLDTYANDLNDDTCYYDDATIASMREEAEGYDEQFDDSWYKGEGWYENGVLIYKHGDEYLRDDVVLYAIEEIEPCVSKREASIYVCETYTDYAREYPNYDDILGLIEALTIIQKASGDFVYVPDVEGRLNPYLDQLVEKLNGEE